MIKNVQEIHEIPIIDVISDFVELKRSGVNYTGCCPFHNEKTPSFVVNPNKNIYKCFGCGEGGSSAVTFLRELQGMSYPEALEYVARKGNVTVEYEVGDKTAFTKQMKEDNNRKKQLWAILNQVTEFYRSQIFGHYLEAFDKIEVAGRIYSKPTIDAFKLSFAPDGNIITKSKKWSEEILKELGIIKTAENGTYDTFRKRSLFPILDNRGNVVGFGGRKLAEDSNKKNPKYLNSKESLAYDKSMVLYGLYQGMKAIRKAESANLVEGYTDVLSFYENGLQNTVATCGTALTEQQAKLLKRYTKIVNIVRDGDEAGYKAAKKDVELLIRCGLNTKVCILPKGEDPDSFIRKYGKQAFDLELEQAEDGLIWRVMEEWDTNNQLKKENAYQLAGELMAYLDSSTLQESYLRELTKKSRMDSVKTILKEIIQKNEEKLLNKNVSPLKKDQERDIINYGIYEDGNRYFVSRANAQRGIQVSNFIVNPIMLVIGATESQRIIEIANEYGKKCTLNIPSKSFTSMTDFCTEVERMGNYLFTGNKAQFAKIKAKVYQRSADCFPITVMGLHREGFYTWGNGISVGDQFHRVNEYGVVQYKDTKYFLPAFSRIQQFIKSDDTEDQFEFEKKFRFYSDLNCVTINEWSRRMKEVHGNNGMMAVAFLCAALYRDIIFRKFSFFPHLNMFGPSGSGKTFICRSIMALFGRSNQHDPFMLPAGTAVAFKRRLAQVANGIIWFDEYSNSVPFHRVEALKNAYDGAGHEKGKMSNDNRTSTTKVKSALLISGQQQPTQDIALFKRVISLNFKSGKNTLEKQIRAKELKALEDTGQFTQITQYLLGFRDLIEEKFSVEVERLRVAFNKQLDKDGHFVEDRITTNHLIPLAIFNILRQELDFGFTIDDLTAFTYQNIIQQSEAIFSEDELSIFWRILEYLHDSKKLWHKDDLIVEERTSEKFMNELDKSKRKDTVEKTFDEKRTLLYIRFSKLHPEYQERHQRQRNKPGLDLQALQYYLKNSEAYLGQKRAKKFDQKTYSCFVFDLEMLPIELPITKGVSEMPEL